MALAMSHHNNHLNQEDKTKLYPEIPSSLSHLAVLLSMSTCLRINMARETPWCTEAARSCGFLYSLQYTKSQQKREEKSGTELGGGFLRLKEFLL